MKYLLITIAVVLLVGCDESQQSAPTPETKSIARVARAKAPGISIHQAVKDGNIEAIKQHLADGVDVNVKDIRGDTPLHVAASNGHKEIADLLITNGADVNAKSMMGLTPLNLASLRGHKEIAELLIGGGADVDSVDNFGNTPLDNAKRNGAMVNPKDTRLETPFDLAIFKRYNETADLLRKHGGKTSEELKAKGE